MATLKAELKQILDRYGINPQDKSQIWDCHGTLVLYHKAYEIIAAKESIQFEPPTVIEGSSENKTVALLVVGKMGARSEWSIGEAAPGNNKNSYPYAMAEKRAKDRVIAKLVGLAAYVYSEDEADEFKDVAHKAPPTEPTPKPTGPLIAPSPTASPGTWQEFAKAVLRAAEFADSVGELEAWQASNQETFAAVKSKSAKLHEWLVAGMAAHYRKLAEKEAA